MGAYAALLFALTLHLQDDLGYYPLRRASRSRPTPSGFATMSLTWRRLPPLWTGSGRSRSAAARW
jgi:hypothetical protein